MANGTTETNDLTKPPATGGEEAMLSSNAAREEIALRDQQAEPAAAKAEQAKPTFAGYPKTKFHPVYGRRSVEDPNQEAIEFQPKTDWFETAEEADMHRTETEAQAVMHRNRMVKGAAHEAIANGKEPPPMTGPDAPKGVVRNSVAAQESLDAGNPEPL